MAKTALNRKIDNIPAALKAFLAAGVAAAGFTVFRSLKGKDQDGRPPTPVVIEPKQVRPTQKTKGATPKQPTEIKRKWIAATFPLRRGMQGEAVGTLQVALNKLGAGLMADGKFGQSTEAALAKLGLAPTVSDEQLRLLQARGSKQQPKPHESKYQRLQRLGYNGPAEIEPAIGLRKEITSTVASDERIRQFLSVANKTATNIQRAYRILYGTDLKKDLLGLTMGWVRFGQLVTRLEALSGLGSAPGKEVVARVNTVVLDEAGNALTVKAGTKLGRVVDVGQETIRFADSNGKIHQAPISDIL